MSARIAEQLLETDALTPNHDGTPEHYIVDAENVEYLVKTVLDLAESRVADLGARIAAARAVLDDHDRHQHLFARKVLRALVGDETTPEATP